MKFYLYILLIVSILSCCTTPSKQYPRYADFPETKALHAKVISLDTALFRYPFRVTVRGDIALVMDLHNADHYFHAFTYPEWKHIISFGKRGEAPEEMLSAETFQFNSIDSIWALDANKMQMTRWSISPENRTAERKEEINVDKSLIRALDFYAINSGFLIPDYLGEHRYNRTNQQGQLLEAKSIIPTETDYTDIARPALAQAWRSFIDYNPTNDIFAMATQLGEVIEIYNLKDNTHTILYGPHGEPKFQIDQGESIPTGIMGFSDVQITEKYIYVVFHGRSFKEIASSLQQGMKHEDGGRFIYVFDLKGNPVRKYILDHAIYGIDVDEKAGYIIATDVNSDEPIIQYNI